MAALLKKFVEIHAKMKTELGKEGSFIDGLYFCPEYTDKGFTEEWPEYKCDCNCRKPKSGLFEQAIRDFNIDLYQSYMIWDSKNDVETGMNAGCKGCFLIGSESLLDIVNRII